MFNTIFLDALNSVYFDERFQKRELHQSSISVPPYGRSKNSVAADRRRAKKRRNIKRAKRLGHYTR